MFRKKKINLEYKLIVTDRHSPLVAVQSGISFENVIPK